MYLYTVQLSKTSQCTHWCCL